MKSGQGMKKFGVASGYVQAFRIAEKVVEVRGDHGFLGASGSIHVGIPK
jgi:hypothetical protein